MTNTLAPLPDEVEKAFHALPCGKDIWESAIETLRAHITALTVEVANLKSIMPEGADVCCCGDYIIGHADPYGCGHTPKSQFEWGQQLQEECLKNLLAL